MTKPDLSEPLTPPRIRHMEARRIVGMRIRCNRDSIGGIPALWTKFNMREDEIGGSPRDATYGVCYDAGADGDFSYLAGAEARDVPKGLHSVTLPAGQYAVFTHEGHVADLPKTVHAIWNKGLAEAGLRAADAPDFERYDSRFNPQTGEGCVEIWVPIAS